jgi:23S rRNA (pseudouridine1915-N3)-methyltransferase
MKNVILAVGKEKDFSGSDLVRDYTERVSHYFPCEWKFIAPSDQKGENGRIIEYLDKEGSGSYIVALDEKGKEFDSRGFADKIQSCLNQSVRSLIFIIGGSYGLTDDVRGKASLVMALSKMTFPHQLIRLFLAEQLYRACTIIRGEKYHHS